MNLDTEHKKQVDFLLDRLRKKSVNVRIKYQYYNAENSYVDFGISVPVKMMNSKPGIGWASRAVNTLSDRVVFDGFANDTFRINELFDEINAKRVLNKAKKDAHIAGVSFVAISETPNGVALIPFTASEATGVIDDNTGLLSYGLAVLSWTGDDALAQSSVSEPKDYVVFTPEATTIYKNKKIDSITKNPTGRTMLHALTHGATASQPLGRSRITKTVRRIVQEVARVKRRYEIAGEFYSTPQRYVLGTEQDFTQEQKNKLDSTIGKAWVFSKDDDGDKPEIGQLAQMSINQFEDNKKGLARDFCAETALTLRNLGYETANPTSAESLSAMSDDLLLEARASQDEMGEQIKQIAISIRLTLNKSDKVPEDLENIKAAWRPIFQVDVGAAGDAVYKLIQAMPELAGSVQIYQMLGMGVREAESLKAIRDKASTNNFMTGEV
jgi:hypothetical protein